MPNCAWWTAVLASIIVATIYATLYATESRQSLRFGLHFDNGDEENWDPRNSPVVSIVPQFLLNHSVYTTSDFRNKQGIAPPFWGCKNESCNASGVWGPCFWPHKKIRWVGEVERIGRTHRPQYQNVPIDPTLTDDLSGLCRPGFLIIGAGKCGTSSLYHYLTDHPRVLPAKEKQIHYFKYYMQYPMQWYLRHFPTASSFLAAGALMSGEASPGYLPYPDVAYRIKKHMPGPRIVAVGRNPLERAYSSYMYNYVAPVMKMMRKGRVPNISRGLTDKEYEDHLFSFEEMARAELFVLRDCLSSDGTGVRKAKDRYSSLNWAAAEYRRREKGGLPPLVDLESFCYGDWVDKVVPRKQWKDLIENNPDKVIYRKNVHLTQSFIGRSLYVLPLEWWYALYSEKEIIFICTEAMSDFSGTPMNKLAEFLGLPPHNFSTIVSKGAYNVGGHRGYDKEISWDEIKDELNVTERPKYEVTLSEDFLREVKAFIEPYNERLFKLIGHRCEW
jgi:hypothetical protein